MHVIWEKASITNTKATKLMYKKITFNNTDYFVQYVLNEVVISSRMILCKLTVLCIMHTIINSLLIYA